MELTPTLAKEMVEQMVSSMQTTRAEPESVAAVPERVLDVTEESLFVMSAARFVSYRVHAAGRQFMPGKQFPIEGKVVAYLDVNKLNLSELARAALLKIVGPRFDAETGEIKLPARRHAIAVENKGYLMSLMTRLYREAKLSVGEEVGETGSLESWREIRRAVGKAGGDATLQQRMDMEIDRLRKDVAAARRAQAAAEAERRKQEAEPIPDLAELAGGAAAKAGQRSRKSSAASAGN